MRTCVPVWQLKPASLFGLALASGFALLHTHAVAATAPVDLSVGQGLSMASASAAWGGALTVADTAAFATASGQCAFNVSYDMKNLGSSNAAGFNNQIVVDGVVASQQTNQTLGAGSARTVYTQMYIKPGKHTLQLIVDAGGLVPDSNTSNNMGTMSVTVTGSCGGTSATSPTSQPDLGSQRGLTVGGTAGGAGGTFGAWSGQIAVKASDAVLQSGGMCAYNLAYDMENTGGATQTPFTNRLYDGSTVIGQQTGLVLGAQQTTTIHTQAYLKPGSQVVYLLIDADKVTHDSNYQNNARYVTVAVDGNCGGTTGSGTGSTASSGSGSGSNGSGGTPSTGKVILQSNKGLSLGGSTSATGGSFIPWEGSAKVDSSLVTSRTGGKCGFNFSYDLENAGTVSTSQPFTDDLYDGSQQVAQEGGFTLAAGQATLVGGQLWLTPGQHALQLRVDAGNLYGGSKRTVNVYVDDTCR